MAQATQDSLLFSLRRCPGVLCFLLPAFAGIETAGPYYAALGSDAPKLVPGVSDYRTKTINVDTINGSGQPSGSPAAVKSVGTSWTTIIGTYEPNKLNPSNYAVGYVTPTGGPAHTLPGKFSLAIRASTACTLVVDYVFAQPQTASVNLAQALANTPLRLAERWRIYLHVYVCIYILSLIHI